MCVCTFAGQRELTPIEEASRLNQNLKANYQARLARLKPGQATQKTSLVSVFSKPSVHRGHITIATRVYINMIKKKICTTQIHFSGKVTGPEQYILLKHFNSISTCIHSTGQGYPISYRIFCLLIEPASLT